MSGKNIILGNGISAKIFALYNREYQIIGPESEQLNSILFNKFLFFQNNKYNKKLLSDIESILHEEIPYVMKQANILFFDGEQYTETVDEDSKMRLIKKKLTSVNGKSLAVTSKIFSYGLRLSEEKEGLLSYIDVDFQTVKDKLNTIIQKQLLSRGNAVNIDLQKRRITLADSVGTSDVCFDSCISTIPANVFWSLTNTKVECMFETLDTSLAVGGEDTLGIPRIPFENAVCYFPQDQFEFSKVVKRNGQCYAEITGHSKRFPNAVVFKNTRFMREMKNIPPKNVVFLGRYAEWNPDTKMQDVIRKSCSKNIMHEIWCDQRQFSGQFFDFTENLNTIQNNVKEMSLLMSNETFDLLNKINWKKHKSNMKVLDINEIREEWIDVFKYWLTIGINLGITFEDFVDAYKEKSEKLWKTLKPNKEAQPCQK